MTRLCRSMYGKLRLTVRLHCELSAVGSRLSLEPTARTVGMPRVPERQSLSAYQAAEPQEKVRSLLILVMLQVQLDDVEDCALRITQHGESSNVRDVCRRNIGSRAQRRRLLNLRVAIINRDVDSPIRWHRSHVRLNFHHAADVIVAVNDLGIRRRTAVSLRLPTEEFRVEIFRFLSIVGQQFIPTQQVRFPFNPDTFVPLRLP